MEALKAVTQINEAIVTPVQTALDEGWIAVRQGSYSRKTGRTRVEFDWENYRLSITGYIGQPDDTVCVTLSVVDPGKYSARPLANRRFHSANMASDTAMRKSMDDYIVSLSNYDYA